RPLTSGDPQEIVKLLRIVYQAVPRLAVGCASTRSAAAARANFAKTAWRGEDGSASRSLPESPGKAWTLDPSLGLSAACAASAARRRRVFGCEHRPRRRRLRRGEGRACAGTPRPASGLA